MRDEDQRWLEQKTEEFFSKEHTLVSEFAPLFIRKAAVLCVRRSILRKAFAPVPDAAPNPKNSAHARTAAGALVAVLGCMAALYFVSPLSSACGIAGWLVFLAAAFALARPALAFACQDHLAPSAFNAGFRRTMLQIGIGALPLLLVLFGGEWLRELWWRFGGPYAAAVALPAGLLWVYVFSNSAAKEATACVCARAETDGARPKVPNREVSVTLGDVLRADIDLLGKVTGLRWEEINEQYLWPDQRSRRVWWHRFRLDLEEEERNGEES